MTQPTVIQVTPELAAATPAAPAPSQELVTLSSMAVTSAKREQLVCKELLVGETRALALREATQVLEKAYGNTQVLTVFGSNALTGVNELNDRMLRERPPVAIPELDELMRTLSRSMRDMGRRYDPSDEKVREKYKNVKGGLFARWGWVKTFFEEFMDDVRSMDSQFDRVIETLEGQQFHMIENVTYYDVFYDLNEKEVKKLIYAIAVMEMMREMAAERARGIQVGNASLGDRGVEKQSEIMDLVRILDSRITAFQGRLWVAWAMAPQIRNMRGISVGLAQRIDETVKITIPTMKSTIVLWQTLSEAEQAAQFNQVVEDLYNMALSQFAAAAGAAVPAIASALATPAMSPETIREWADSLSAQADGLITAEEEAKRKRADMIDAMVKGKTIIDEATMRVNTALLESVIEQAREAENLQIATSVN